MALLDKDGFIHFWSKLKQKHIDRTDNPHSVTKAQVGLGDVLNVPSYSKSEVDTKLNTKLNTNDLASNLLSKVYPVGSIYLSVNSTSPASFIGGTWEKLPEGYALWTATSGGGNTIDAGLPNITGSAGVWGDTQCSSGSGAMAFNLGSWSYDLRQGSDANLRPASSISFNASNANSIYGKSSTVQPPAYNIYAWKRTN